MPLTVLQPDRLTLMIKPVGPLCNLRCTYCYYLGTRQAVFGGHAHRMSLRTLEDIFASVLPRFGDEVTIAWQGGEPTLAGLPFFQKAVEFQRQYRRPGQQVRNALQTNGTLLDDAWCKFLKQNDFLVGLSVDGPRDLHDHYRLTAAAEGSAKQVHRGLRRLQQHQVEFNLLCVLNDRNVHEPDKVLAYLLNLGTRYLQFIPAIEWLADPTPEDPHHRRLAPFSPDAEAYGRFLCRVFDLWYEKYCYRLSVRDFDAVLNQLVLGQTPLCTLDGSCHTQLTVEHDGSVFGCDHYVQPQWRLARIGEPAWANDEPISTPTRGFVPVSADVDATPATEDGPFSGGPQGRDGQGERHLSDPWRPTDRRPRPYGPALNHDADPTYPGHDRRTPFDPDPGDPSPDPDWFDRVDRGRMAAFAARKRNLPDRCKRCRWERFCYGGCPKHRTHGGDRAEPTTLCAAYQMFFEHAMPRLEWMASHLRRNQMPPAPGMQRPRDRRR